MSSLPEVENNELGFVSKLENLSNLSSTNPELILPVYLQWAAEKVRSLMIMLKKESRNFLVRYGSHPHNLF